MIPNYSLGGRVLAWRRGIGVCLFGPLHLILTDVCLGHNLRSPDNDSKPGCALRDVKLGGIAAYERNSLLTNRMSGGFSLLTNLESNLREIELRVNGRRHQLTVAAHRTLLEALRDSLDLTGAKSGCDRGECGGVHRHCGGAGGVCLPDAGVAGGGPSGGDGGRVGERRWLPSIAGRLSGAGRRAVRVLHAGLPDGGKGPCWTAIWNRTGMRCAGPWRATSAGAMPMGPSLNRSWQRPGPW